MAKAERYAIIILPLILILQLTHTIFMAAGDAVYFFEQRRLLMTEPKYSLWTASWIFALAAEVLLLRLLSKHKNWVWALMLIVIINSSLFLALDVLRVRSLPLKLDVVLLTAASFGIVDLYLRRNAYAVTRNDIFQVSTAILLWGFMAPVVSRRYCDFLGIFLIPGHAFSLWPQELHLLVCWACYALIAVLSWSFRGLRKIPSFR